MEANVRPANNINPRHSMLFDFTVSLSNPFVISMPI